MNTARMPKLPNADFQLEVEPGGIKKIKSENRRADAMSYIDPNKLTVIDGFNVRVRDAAYLAHIRTLADSMKEVGFKIDKPIACYIRKVEDGEDEICITDGHSRHEAVLLAIDEGAAIDTVPVVLLPNKGISMADLTVDLVRANAGRPLSTYETSIVVKRLTNMEFEEDEIAEKLGFSRTHVTGLLLLAAAPKPLANLVVAGKVSATTAIDMLRKHGPAKATDLLKAAAAKAEESGKSKVTAAVLPGANFHKALKKSSPKLYESARQIQRDPGYTGLSMETRELLDSLLQDLTALEPATAEAAHEH